MPTDYTSRLKPLAERLAAERTARWSFIALCAVLLPLMIVASFDFGVSWDEITRHAYGVQIWEFVRGIRSRASFPQTGGHVYPGLFDTICAAVESWLPGNRYVLRHIVNATFGWIGIVYCGRLAGRLFGPWFAVLGALFLALSPRYFAGSMNNPKDVPFAAMAMVALYYISTVSPRWPYVSIGTALKVAVAIALALNIRVGALLYLGYFGLLVAALAVLERQTDWRRLAGTAMRLGAVAVAVLLLGTLFWPWAGASPFVRPFQALFGAAGYPWQGSVLFDRVPYQANELPWSYAPWWFVISTPPVILAGAALSLVFASGRADVLRRIGLWIVAILPVGAAILTNATLYDGHRHLMFAYPALVLVATAGWSGMLHPSRPAWLRLGSAGVVAVGLVSILIVNIRFHPNQGVYFNSIVGGTKGAFARYEMDYWGNCMLQAIEWAAQVGRSFGTPVRVTGDPGHIVQLNAERFPEVEFTDGDLRLDHFRIEMARGSSADFRKLASRPAFYRVRTPDGAVLCTVSAGPAYGPHGLGSPGERPDAKPE